MRVLLTGSEGYIGGVLAPMLADAGHQVTGLDSGLFRPCLFGGSEAPAAAITRDIRDVAGEDIEGCDAVIHLAGLSNDPLGDLDANLTLEINYEATARLARLARDAGAKRFVFASSCSNYGAGDDGILDEESPFNPVTPYGKSKVLAEEALASLADDRFSPVSLRIATAYGVSPRLRFDLVINNLVAWAMTTGKVLLKSDGTPWRPVVHVEDIARAFLAILEAPREAVHNEAFNVVGDGANYRIREIADLVAEIVPDSSVELATGAGPDRRTYRVDGAKIRERVPAFRPRWEARRGIAELCDAYREGGLEPEDFEGPRFHRLKFLTGRLAAGRLDPSLRVIPAKAT